MKRRLRFLLLALVPALLLGLAIPVYAQVHIPDITFRIDQIEAYKNYRELDDQLYLISFTNKYNTAPSTLIDDAFIFRLMNGAVELGTTTAYGFHNNGYASGIATIYFSEADAPAWSGAYTVEFNGNPTLHWLDTTATTLMEGAVADDGGVLTDETTASNNATANVTTLLPATPAIGDAYYFGSDGMFDILTINIGQQGAWTGTYTWEYWNGSDWAVPVWLNDASTGFTAGVGNYDITFPCPTNWQSNSIDGISAYWLRMRVTAYSAIVTQPLGTQFWVNTLDNPPSTESSTFSLWYDDGTISATENQLTIRLRALAQLLGNDWTTDLIESTSAGNKFTSNGEDYFTNSVPDLRDACPSLFSAVMVSPEFDELSIVEDNYMGGDDGDEDVETTDWLAQTWTTSENYYIKGVWIKAFRVGTPGDSTVSVRATGASLPTGADLASGTIDADDFTTDTDGEWYEVSFTDHYELDIDTEYSIVVRALAGGATDYVSWRVDITGEEADGQAVSSANSGVAWAALAGTQDFMFNITATDFYSMNLRDRLAQTLVGTRFDMTDLAADFNMSRMWMSSIVWFGICLLITVAAVSVIATRNPGGYKYTTLFMAFLLPFGAPTGFMYLEVPILLAMFFAAASVFILFHRGATA